MKNQSTTPVALASKVLNDPRWAFVVARDKSVDGQFYYSVKTTGVFCRPSCPSRTPNPENVQFHTTVIDAEQAGFRPCKRCKPTQPPLEDRQASMIEKVCRFIEESETPPTLEAIASMANMSPYHFHRIFKQVTGLTPKAYATAVQAKRVRHGLSQCHSVTEAIYDAGYGAQSRFYEKTSGMLGMTPTRFKSGGIDTEIRFAIGECSLGSILVAASTRGICTIALGDAPEKLLNELQDQFPRATLVGGDSVFEEWVAKVVGFVETPSLGLDLPLDIRGTAFQQRVWQALREIPVGTRVSYTDIANRIDMPKAVRAVAGACASNKLAVAIPCHRVVRSDGDLSGYRWGIERKQALLERESAPGEA